MANLRLKRIRVVNNTSIRAQFTSSLDPIINASNIDIEPNLPGIPKPVVLSVRIKTDTIDIKTQPLTPFTNYVVTFKSDAVRFKSLNGQEYLVEDGKTNIASITGPVLPSSSVRDALTSYVEDGIYNLDGEALINKVINSQDMVLSRALYDIGQAANDNYLEVLITDERHIRGSGPWDRLNQEGTFEVSRVGLTRTGYAKSLTLNYDEFPRDIITLKRKDIVGERLIAGSGPVSTFNDLILTTSKYPVTKLNLVTIVYQDNSRAVYDPEIYGYQIKDVIYDSSHASKYLLLEDNQFRLSEWAFETIEAPTAGDYLLIDYEYKSLGRQIDETTVTVTQAIDAVREVAPPIINEFSLEHAPVITSQDIIPTSGGIQFLNPRACLPFSETHPAFTKELPYNIAGLPKAIGEYCVDYESGRVFVYGAESNDGTGVFPPAITYKYRKSFNSTLDYIYNPETSDLTASPLRELIGETAKISFNYEDTLVPGIDYIADAHTEVLDERINNRLATLSSLYVDNNPITNAFRVYNETTGEIYPISRFTDNLVYFSYNTPPAINDELRERVSFSNVNNELLITESSSINTYTKKVLKIVLLNNRIIASTEDCIGSSFNSSVGFSRTDIFNTELYYDSQELDETTNKNKLSAIGQYIINYEDGIIYVAVSNTQDLDLGTVSYKSPYIVTNNKHIISVSNLYHSLSSNSTVSINVDYTSFDDTEIIPASFERSDERYINDNTSASFTYYDGTITVTDNIKDIRKIYDAFDLNNNIVPTDFANGATFSGNVITLNADGINKANEEYTVNASKQITVDFISAGIEIGSINSITYDGYELLNGSTTFAGNTITIPLADDGYDVIVSYQVILNGGSTPIVDYNRGDLFAHYSYLSDEILVSYEYGDNVIDFRESSTIDTGTEYFVTYKVGALRDALLSNFGSLVDLPIMNTFDTSLPRESYRDALQGALQSFTKGPTIPSMKQLVSSITKIDPEIIESVFDVWSLGISSLYPNQIGYSGNPQLLSGKFDNGVLLETDGDSVTFNVSSNLRLEEGTLEMWVIPNWNGIDNDATLTFSNLKKDNVLLGNTSIFIGADSHNPTMDLNNEFVLVKDDAVGLPSAIFTNTGIFIYYDSSVSKWKFLAKDDPSELHYYTGRILTSGEFYDVKHIENLGEASDIIRSTTNQIDFRFGLDGYDVLSPDGYATIDGYVPGNSFDGIMFLSDDQHYLFDFAESKAKNRFSIYKDGRGFLNFEIFDNRKRLYKISSDISDWSAGQKYHIATTWKIDSWDRKDEMHLFINGFEVPNILKYGGRPIATLTDRFRVVKPEVVAGTVAKKIIKGNDLHTIVSLDTVYSPTIDFEAAGIIAGDTIDILEIGYGAFTILDVDGFTLTLDSPVVANLNDARYSVNKFTAIISDEIDLSANVAISIISGTTEAEIPGLRADFPSYTIDKNSSLQTILTVLGPAEVGDQIVIRTLGLNHRRCRENVYLWGDIQSVLKTKLPPPINLDEVKIIPVILPLVNINPTTATVVGSDFVLSGLVPSKVSNITEGRIIAVRVTGGNVDFTNPAQVVITGTSSSGVTETLSFSEAGIQNSTKKWKTITDVTVTVTPLSLLVPSVSLEIKEAYSITDPNGNNIFPIIRYSFQNNSGNTLTGDGYTIENGLFTDRDVGSKLVIESPIGVAGTYTIASFIDETSVTVTEELPIAFTGGIYKVYNTTIGRSGFQNGFFTFEIAGQVNTPYLLAQGQYEFDYACYLEIPFDNVGNQIAYIGSDFTGSNYSKAVIDELRTLSRMITDVRVGESLSVGQQSITTDYTALRAFYPDTDTLFLCHFDSLPFVNEAWFYKIANKEYLQSSDSVNSSFGQSLVINERPYKVDNVGYLSTASEGTVEFWVSPRYDTYNDPNERYYFDASSSVEELVTSLSSGTIQLDGRASEVISVRLQVDQDNTGTDYYIGGRLEDDFKTITLGKALPGQQTLVKVAYIPNGFSGNRLSIFKDKYGFLVFRVIGDDQEVYEVRQPIFWQRDSWHRIFVTYKFNRRDSRDEIRLFIDGRESGSIRFGQGFIFGSGIVFSQGIFGQELSRLTTDINFTDLINEFYIGSAYNKTKISAARFDNIKISNISRTPLVCSGVGIDENYQTNTDIVYPVIEDLYTTWLMDFNKLLEKNEDYAVVRDESYGIFNFIINVIDSFNKVSGNAKMDQILRELILALKPAQSKVEINILK